MWGDRKLFALKTHDMTNRQTASPDTQTLAPVSGLERDDFQITPFMALAVSLIYMLTADGEIDDHESSQLQAVVGNHNELLDISFIYAEENSVEQFLKDTSGVLNQADHWCILTNLCDCLLSDGVADEHELNLFRKMSDAYGVSEMGFKTHFNNLKVKNNKSLLGKFTEKSLTLTDQSAHLTLACCLLYMMAADGNIADEEIGQLQVVLGEFEGLQAVAMKTVRSIKMHAFLRQAAPLLTQDQKIMILSNVCDSMMSDGKVDVIEDNLFQTMLTAFSVSVQVFKTYHDTIKIKNIKPFDTDSIPTAFHSRISAKNKQGDTGTFKVRRQKNANAETTGAATGAAKSEGEWVSEVDQKQLSAVVHRTMQDNIKQANEGFAGQSDVEKVQKNAVNQSAPNFSDASGKTENLQAVKEGVAKENVQKVDVKGINSNQANVSEVGIVANIQQTSDDTLKDNKQKLASAAQVANIQQANDEALKDNKQKLASAAEAANIQQANDEALKDNKQRLASASEAANVQQIKPVAELANKQAAPDAALLSSRHVLPSQPLSVPQGKHAGQTQDRSATHTPQVTLQEPNKPGTTLVQAALLKMVDPKSVQALQTQIDKVHTHLDKLSPSQTPKTAVSGFASLVLETRLPANNQLKQKPSTSLVQAANTLVLPAFEKNLQPLADEPLPTPSESMMLSNLTQSIHSDDAWALKDEGLSEASSDARTLSSMKTAVTDSSVTEIAVNGYCVAEAAATETIAHAPSATEKTAHETAVHETAVHETEAIQRTVTQTVATGFVAAAVISHETASEAVLADGSVDWRVLWLLIALCSLPAVMFGRGLLYPSQICHGVGQLERKWTPQGSDKSPTLLNEESVALSHRIQFSPSQVWVDGQRFPLYKELNQTSHTAESTATGVKGHFNTQGIAKTRYAFVYDQAIQELRIDMQSSGLGSVEGKVGSLEENTSFIGRCANDWF
jgi:uncharacterized tellurite resistance protein B-like protein